MHERARARSAEAAIGAARPADDRAEAEIAVAKTETSRAQADVEQSTIRAPVTGTVLGIHTRPGEQVGEAGILDMAQTARMFVVAEVFETDIARVRKGSKARIFGVDRRQILNRLAQSHFPSIRTRTSMRAHTATHKKL